MVVLLLTACAPDAPKPPDDTDPGVFAGTYADVRCGSIDLCATTTDGELRCWFNATSTPADPSEVPSHPRDFDVDYALYALDAGGALVAPEFLTARFDGTYTKVEVGGTDGACLLADGGVVSCEDFECRGFPTETDPGYLDFVRLNDYFCALDAAGDVTCWGAYPGAECERKDLCDCFGGPLTLPGPYVAFARGEELCLLDAAGEVTCPFLDGVPPDGPFEQVYADGYACGVRRDGTAACWGPDAPDQPDAPVTALCHRRAWPDGYGACVIGTDGALRCTGAYADWIPVPEE